MFKVISTTNELIEYRAGLQESVGLVPTMGNLHEGHLSLISESLNENAVTICTIFVNPKQFGPNEDFASYPRTLDQDVQKLKKVFETFPEAKQLTVFAPLSPEEIYTDGFDTTINVGDSLTNKLCGLSRPGHFAGVTTVVYSLFALTEPTRAYFGQKDYQQLKVIERMTRDLRIPIQIKSMPIIREKDGLALSSRNQYLTKDERSEALTLSKGLKIVEECLKNGKDWTKLKQEFLQDNRWEYLEVLNSQDLTAINDQTEHVLIAGAFRLGQTRLIDNILTQRK